jgi:hypothetical protein
MEKTRKIGWSRRQFMEASAAALAMSQLRTEAQLQPGASSAPLPPEVIAGSVRPLLEGTTARPMRYQARERGFAIANGSEFFNRPLYGPNNGFRVDAGDLPEFSLYLPGHAGNLRLGVSAHGRAKWLAEADRVEASYTAGRMIYEVRDALLGAGVVRVELLTAGVGASLLVRAEATNVGAGVALSWAFGGVSGRKGRRSGDIGCEAEPVARFFRLRPEECAKNVFTFSGAEAHLASPFCALALRFPRGAQLRIEDAEAWDRPVVATQSSTRRATERPILVGWTALEENRPALLAIAHIEKEPPEFDDLEDAFATRRAQLVAIANAVQATSPDACIDAAFAALNVAADAVWDEKQQCVMHGGVAWRMPLAGWRGPYALDALGAHRRMQQQVRHWIAQQNTEPVTTADPATGPFDAKTHQTRKEALLHSNGNLTKNHYDMNLVFFDALFRHLRWTGDLALAREIWPALQRHLAWEHRLFRRVYRTEDGRALPLYEAYAAIWASDNLQYNGGGVAHASAYNLFALRGAAQLAHLLGEDATAYEHEAALLAEGIEKLLWLPEGGVLAESKDLLGPQTAYDNPALWTLYHAIDSEAVNPAQSWQMVAERLHALRRVPVHGAGVPAGDWYLLSCSNWLPYMWSLNLLVLAEGVHMALALWQSGMNEEAFALLKGNLLDSMFQGITPGNFHMSSQLDAHRQEAQRDFADPIGITARALVEGLFGITPNLLEDKLTLRPGFPAHWDHAALAHPDFDYAWKREGRIETLAFTSRLSKPVALTLRLRARGTEVPEITLHGAHVAAHFDAEAVGTPAVVCTLPAAHAWTLRIAWRGAEPVKVPAARSLQKGAALALPAGVIVETIDDPQRCIAEGKIAAEGFHTVFARVRQGACRWRLPLSFAVASATPKIVPFASYSAAQMAPIDLDAELRDDLRTILTRDHSEPRSPYCSLAFPEQLIGGWSTMSLIFSVDDSGLRKAGGTLRTGVGVPFRTPTGNTPNARFLSYWSNDAQSFEVALHGRAVALALLVTGTTLPQTSRMRHGSITVRYADGGETVLPLVNPSTWWPIEQDFLLDDYLFVNEAALPARVDLATGATRILDAKNFKGKGREIPGGAATILGLALDPERELASVRFTCELYGMVVAVLGATLIRPR